MGFMRPEAEYFEMYHINAEYGTEYLPAAYLEKDKVDVFIYLKGGAIYGIQRRMGWYGRLSAPGYLDATDWIGPYDSEEAALRAVQEMYDVDVNGDDA